MSNSVWHWTAGGDDYFLRDDRGDGLCAYECYSLFRGGTDYGHIITLRMSLEEAFKAVPQMIQQDQHSLHGSQQ